MTVGAELLLGFTVDSNAATIARAMARIGVTVERRTTVPDDAEAIRAAVGDALARTRIVIVTGGLGPTRDDVTKHAVAALFEMPIALDEAALARLEHRWAALRRSGRMPEANRTQAEVPLGATVLPNPRGTAPGLWLEGKPGVAVLLPGVPHEMRGLLEEEVVPRIEARLGADGARTVVLVRTLRTTGVAESALADRLGPLEASVRPVTVAYLPSFAGVDVRLVAARLDAAAAARALDHAEERVRGALGPDCYGADDVDLAAVVLDLLRARGMRLAVAESCTGGLVGARITAAAGASEVFVGGAITYADEWKTAMLDVPMGVIDQHGAVSQEVVAAMAAGARRRFGVEAAVAVSGIAGPTGGTPAKPVGTVWFGVSMRDAHIERRIVFPGGREEVRARAAQAALDLLRRCLVASPAPANSTRSR